ncbi:nuclear RNA export factor 1-like [Liolophura sinensis]|uniref:nuclear RNA export factor 1-like n=1 Tax=Liolophura sinensis TaxID=3198878 RepID=UPI0031585A2D
MSYRGGRGKTGGGFSVTTERDGSRSFDDDRRSGGPRKNFRRGRGSYRGRGRGYGGPRDRDGPNPRSRLDEDGDTSMKEDSVGPSTSRYTPYGARPNNRRTYVPGGSKLAMDRSERTDISHRVGSAGGGSRNKRRGRDFDRYNELSDTGWYKVTIPYGSKTDKKVLLDLLNSHLDVPFQPIQYRHENKSAVFYLDDESAANAIKGATQKITLPTGFKIITVVRPCYPPANHITESTIEKLKVCMSDRYDAAGKALDLSSLFQDPKLSAEGIHLALNKFHVMNEVVKIIEEHIPELTSLDLSNNRLMSLDSLKALVSKTPNMTHLNLGKNCLKLVDELSKIRGWKLTELVLDGNDLCDNYKERSAYISAVRKHQPKVLKLDGQDLPPPITFDLESSTDLPPPKDNYFKTDGLRDLMVKFLKQYLDVFDSDSRHDLMAAYHDQATFSMTFGYNRMISGKQPNWQDLMDCRNLLRVKDTERRLKMLKCGKLSIVSFLSSSSFPKTKHDRNSLHVDVNIVTNELLMFSVTGLFKEVTSRNDREIVRAFRRVFSTISLGGGIVITNDMLSVTNASPEQVQGAFKNPAPTPSSSPVLGAAPLQNPLEGADGARMAMVQQFSTESGMNMEWSSKCLEQNAWNFEKAAKIFTDLQKEGRIPPEAFKH